MADIISNLPDEILCHILYFLPTKQSIVTSILSKRWKLLWRSVPALHFVESLSDDDNDIDTHTRFVESLYAFTLSRDMDQPFRRFHLESRSFLFNPFNLIAWLSAALQRRVENLFLSITPLTKVVLPSALFSCKTLVVLELIGGLNRNPFPLDFKSADLPLLKTLYLQSFIVEPRHIAELLRGSPNLESLYIAHMYFSGPEAMFQRLPKLLRATIATAHVPLEVANNVQFLRVDWTEHKEEADLIPEFQNLTHLELRYSDCTRDWVYVLEVIKRCPNLQILDIDMGSIDMTTRDDEGADCPFSRPVPSCISLHLKTCIIRSYGGSKGELRFARYIMQNARHLRSMKISAYASRQQKFNMLKKLSLCPRRSRICKLSFKAFEIV